MLHDKVFQDTGPAQPAQDASIEAWADHVVQSAPDWMQDKRASVLFIAEAAAHPRFAALAQAVDVRSLGCVTPERAAEQLARIAHVDVVVLDAPDADGLQALLPQLVFMLHNGDSRLILACPLEGLDAGFAAIDRHALRDAPVHWLCAPDATDWATALTLACDGRRRPLALHDVGRESDTSRLQRLSDEVERLARTLDMLRAGHVANGGTGNGTLNGDGALRDRNAAYAAPHAPGWPMVSPPEAGIDGEETMTAQTVRDLLRSRCLRSQFFGDDLFADPAWDMMLDLMAARLAGERVSVSSLCIASAVPPTTALRWIRHLTDRGIFERRPDPLDGRRIFIALADNAADAMQRWYAASRRARREASG